MDPRTGFNQDFLDILAALVQCGAEFVVVGAHAMAVHGVPRATGDLDLFVRPSDENAAQVLAALRRFGAPVTTHGVSQRDLATPGSVYQIGLPPRRIDIITEISGVTFDEAWNSRVAVAIAGMQVGFISRENLLRNKLAAKRDKDLADARLLQRPPSDPSEDT